MAPPDCDQIDRNFSQVPGLVGDKYDLVIFITSAVGAGLVKVAVNVDLEEHFGFRKHCNATRVHFRDPITGCDSRSLHYS